MVASTLWRNRSSSPNTITMWNSELHLRTHYVTCQSLAFNIAKFMSKHCFSETSTSEAHELHDMVTAMSHSLRETEDLWDEIVEIASWPRRPQIRPFVKNPVKCRLHQRHCRRHYGCHPPVHLPMPGTSTQQRSLDTSRPSLQLRVN